MADLQVSFSGFAELLALCYRSRKGVQSPAGRRDP